MSVVVALALTDNGISEVTIGLRFAAEWDILAFACRCGAVSGRSASVVGYDSEGVEMLATDAPVTF